MKKIFKCICNSHLLEIRYSNTIEWVNIKTKKKHKENTPEMWIGIYDIYGGKSGRKLKKPKLVTDFEVMGSHPSAKEMDFLMNFLSDISLAYALRRK